jgi:methyl-accepting chemotaxis protein
MSAMQNTSRVSIYRSFRVIQIVVGLQLVFLVVQGSILWRVCNQGALAIRGLEREGLPGLRCLASLQENLVVYRLRSYELMFVPEQDRPAKVTETDVVQRKNLEIIEELKKLYPDGQGREHVVNLQNCLGDYIQSMNRIRGSLDKDFVGAMKMLDQEVPPKVKLLSAATEQMKMYSSDITDQRTALTVASFRSIRQYVLWLGSAGIAFAAVMVVLVTVSSARVRRALNTLVEKLSGGTDRLVDSANTVAGASVSLAKGSSDQAASLEETSASIEEMASMTKRNAQTAEGSRTLASQTRQAAESGVQSTQEMARAMTGIKTASAEMREAMNGIKAASGDVSKIIKTIDEIAFQTNILALNAAVEAARAGEAGMGFAVVADEVRNLAQRSAKAARETSNMIETAIQRSEAGVRVNEKVGLAIDDVAVKSQQVEARLMEIVGSVQKMDEASAEVALASKEQSSGIGQVNSAVGEMDRITQGSAASAEETASAAEELNSQAAELKQAVGELQELVGGPSTQTGRASLPHEGPPGARKAVREPRPAAAPMNGTAADHPHPEAGIPMPSTPVPDRSLPADRDVQKF